MSQITFEQGCRDSAALDCVKQMLADYMEPDGDVVEAARRAADRGGVSQKELDYQNKCIELTGKIYGLEQDNSKLQTRIEAQEWALQVTRDNVEKLIGEATLSLHELEVWRDEVKSALSGEPTKLQQELEVLRGYAGDEVNKSDFQTAADMRSNLDLVTQQLARCQEVIMEKNELLRQSLEARFDTDAIALVERAFNLNPDTTSQFVKVEVVTDLAEKWKAYLDSHEPIPALTELDQAFQSALAQLGGKKG